MQPSTGNATAFADRSAREEWRQGWPLVFTATAGMSVTVVHLYSLGVLMAPIQAEFGWSRTQITVGQTISAACSILLAPICGLLMKRFGARRPALCGLVAFCAALAALGWIGKSLIQWYLIWTLLALAMVGLKPNLWTGAASPRFQRSRALAFAVIISGISLSSAIVPMIAAFLLEPYGWRGAYIGMAGLWLVVLLPLCFLFLDRRVPAVDQPDRPAAAAPGLSVRDGLRSPAFLRLSLAGFLFTLGLVAITFHFVPLLRDRGIATTSAAAVTGMIGLFSIVGRMFAGVLLDRFSGALVGGIALTLPIIPVLLLILIPSTSIPLLMLFAGLIGLAVGSELDVLAYLASRHFGLRNFGTLFGFLISVLAAATSIAPLLASAIRDSTGSYSLVLWLTIPAFLLSACAIATIGSYPSDFGDKAADAR